LPQGPQPFGTELSILRIADAIVVGGMTRRLISIKGALRAGAGAGAAAGAARALGGTGFALYVNIKVRDGIYYI